MHQSPRLAAGLLWRSLLANAVRGWLGLRLGLGGGSPSRKPEHLKEGRDF